MQLDFCLWGWTSAGPSVVRGAFRKKTLFLPPLLGGTVGAILGMRMFHHKTKHWYFRYGLPALLVVQLALAGWLYWKFR